MRLTAICCGRGASVRVDNQGLPWLSNTWKPGFQPPRRPFWADEDLIGGALGVSDYVMYKVVAASCHTLSSREEGKS